MKDVAKQANVSIATVSHVINKTRYVSPELVERVKSAMESLDYKPNNTARDLRSNKVKSIGLIIPDISSPFFFKHCKECRESSCREWLWLDCVQYKGIRTQIRNVY